MTREAIGMNGRVQLDPEENDMHGSIQYAQFSDHELGVALCNYDDGWFTVLNHSSPEAFSRYVYERHRCREELECRREANASIERANRKWEIRNE
jgi:hypothetical protein